MWVERRTCLQLCHTNRPEGFVGMRGRGVAAHILGLKLTSVRFGAIVIHMQSKTETAVRLIAFTQLQIA